jgi:transcriptional regulator with XRE-family HTH domain
LNLNLLQGQVADQFGVHEQTITNWERNASSPEIRYIPTIIQFLGYDPLPSAGSFPERLAWERKVLGLSQRKMAEKLGVDPATLMGWEAGRHQPTRKSLEGIARTLPPFEIGLNSAAGGSLIAGRLTRTNRCVPYAPSEPTFLPPQFE